MHSMNEGAAGAVEKSHAGGDRGIRPFKKRRVGTRPSLPLIHTDAAIQGACRTIRDSSISFCWQ